MHRLLSLLVVTGCSLVVTASLQTAFAHAGGKSSGVQGRSPEDWIRQLERPDRKSDAITGLAAIGAPAVPSVVSVLTDKKYAKRVSLQLAAMEVLARMGPVAKDAAVPLIESLADGYAGTRALPEGAVVEHRKALVFPELPKGVTTFGQKEIDAAVGAVRLLEQEQIDISIAAASALRQIGDAAIAPLVSALGDRRDSVRVGAAKALESMQKLPDSARSTLMDALRDPHHWVRASIARVLSKYDAQVVPSLVDVLKRGGTPDERQAVALTLYFLRRWVLDDEEARKTVIECLADKDSQTQILAALTLYKRPPREALPVLIAALPYSDLERRDMERIAKARSLAASRRVLPEAGWSLGVTEVDAAMAFHAQNLRIERRLEVITAICYFGADGAEAAPILKELASEKGSYSGNSFSADDVTTRVRLAANEVLRDCLTR